MDWEYVAQEVIKRVITSELKAIPEYTTRDYARGLVPAGLHGKLILEVADMLRLSSKRPAEWDVQTLGREAINRCFHSTQEGVELSSEEEFEVVQAYRKLTEDIYHDFWNGVLEEAIAEVVERRKQ